MSENSKKNDKLQYLLKIDRNKEEILYNVLSLCDNKSDLIKDALFHYINKIELGEVINRHYPYNKLNIKLEIKPQEINANTNNNNLTYNKAIDKPQEYNYNEIEYEEYEEEYDEDYLEENEIEKLDVKEFEDIAGYGIIGNIHNQKIIVGNSKILNMYNIDNMYVEDEKKLAQKGNTIIYVVQNEQIVALIGVNDIIRTNVIDVVKKLSNYKINTIMLTGDNKETAEKIAKDIGITKVVSNVLPSEKAKVINQLKQENKYVMMCGDGINDSPALATADIGVSVKSGTDIAIDSSEVILTKNSLESIIELINISKKTIRIIKENLFWAFLYNMLMIPIAMGLLQTFGIRINPMFASFAMVISSLTVILNTLRLKKISK